MEPPQLVEVVGEVVLGAPGRCGEHQHRELVADRRRHLGQVTCRRAETVEARGDQGVHRGGQRDRSGGSGAEPRTDRLDDEQRVALGLRPQPRDGVGGQGPPADECGHLGGRLTVQGTEADHGPGEVAAPPGDQLCAGGVFVADRAGDEDRS